MVRALGEAFTGVFSGWEYNDPRAFGWVDDADEIARIACDPLAMEVTAVLARLQADGLLPVGPRGVGYVMLGTTVNGRKVIKTKKNYGPPGTKSERIAFLADFYDFQDIGDTLVAMRRARLIPMAWVLDGRTESHNPLVAINAEAVRQSAERVAKAFGPDFLADQHVYCEWWCEAQGLARTVANLLTPYGISVYSGSGDNPLPAVEACARRIRKALRAGKTVVICIVGDFDLDGLENADRFERDVEAFLEHDGLDNRVDWRWVAPQPFHLLRWPILRAAQEAGKSRGDKSLDWTMQGEALLRGGVLATIVKEEMEGRDPLPRFDADDPGIEGVFDMDEYEATQETWDDKHAPVIASHLGTVWQFTEDEAWHLAEVLVALWWHPEAFRRRGGTPPTPEQVRRHQQILDEQGDEDQPPIDE